MNKYATKEDVTISNTDQLRNIFSNNINKCKSIVIVTGFLTKKGFAELIKSVDEKNIKKIKKIVVGVYTSSAQKAYEYITKDSKYSHIKLYIFNNRTLETEPTDKNNIKFSPILHAKIIAGYDKEIVWAYTGSANLTDFAFNDKNIESGVFLNKSNLLKPIDARIKKIFSKKNILEFKNLDNSLVCNPTDSDPDIYEISTNFEKNYTLLKRTYIVFVKSPLNNRRTNIIGLYSKDFVALPENIFSLNTKIILVFTDNVIEPTIVKGPAGERDYLKDPIDIDFYIHKKTELNESGFIIEDSYSPNSDNKKFVILEDKNNSDTIVEYSEIITHLNNLFKIDFSQKSILNTQHLSIGNSDYKKEIIIEEEKKAVKFDPKKLKDNVFNLNDLKFETIKKEITLFHLKADDKRLNEPINLKIKNK